MNWSGEKLTQTMEEFGFSRLRVADELKVHPDTVKNWQDGTAPRAKSLLALAELFSCVVTDFYVREVAS